MTEKPVPIAVDLFCGCGGVTEGLKQAGYSIVAAVDNNPVCCETYKLNHPDVCLFQEDIRKVNPKKIKKLLNSKILDLLVVCAPCQPFSNLNKNKKTDERVNLILEAVRFANVLKPENIFFENVPGLTKNNDILEMLKSKLKQIGYHLSVPFQVDAADYGVPQRRIRCVLIASRESAPSALPLPITPEGNRFTVREAIEKLPPAPIGTNSGDSLHISRKHNKITIERLRHISQDGGSRSELPQNLVLRCHKKLDESGESTSYSDVYGRMKWDDVAPTLTTGCTDVTKGRYAHPCCDRAITLREAALLQTFPVSYEFCGNTGEIAMQIGNAVPVNLVKNLLGVFGDN